MREMRQSQAEISPSRARENNGAAAADFDSLGKTPNIASTPPNEVSRAVVFAKRAERYMLQSEAARLLRDRQERVARCRRDTVPGKDTVDLMFSKERERAYLANLFTCGSVWHCPVCAARITEQRRQELTAAINESDLTVYLLTFTMRHQFTDLLKTTLDALIDGYRLFKGGRRWQAIQQKFRWVGSIRGLETTHGDNGWHPHAHVLAFLEKPLDKAGLEDFTAHVRFKWLLALESKGRDASWERGVDVRATYDGVADYVQKFGHQPVVTGWTLESELTKSPVKIGHADGRTPFQLLADSAAGDEVAGRLFVEFGLTFKGRNQLVWSRGLRARLGLGAEIPDEQIAVDEMSPVDELLARLQPSAWRQILKHERRAEFEEAGREGDKARVEAFLLGMGMYQETDERS